MDEYRIKELAAKIIAGEHVSRWDVMPCKNELKLLLRNDEEAFDYLLIMIEEAEN